MTGIAMEQLSNTAVVGEYTSPAGPEADDYFLVLVTWDGHWLEVPSDGAREREVLSALEQERGIQVQMGLADRTDWASRVLFPKELQGAPLFVFEREGSSLRRLLRVTRTFGTEQVQVRLSPQVQEYLATHGSGSG